MQDGSLDLTGFSSPEGLTNEVLKLDVLPLRGVSNCLSATAGWEADGGIGTDLSHIDKHTWWNMSFDRFRRDHCFYSIVRNILSVGGRRSLDLLHRRPNDIVDESRAKLHVARIKIRQGTNWVIDSVVEKLSPARKGNIGVEVAGTTSSGAIPSDEIPSSISSVALVAKRANAQLVVKRVFDCPSDRLRGATDADSREDNVVGECFEQGYLDIESILKQQDSRMTRSDSRTDKVSNRRANVRHVFSGTNDVVKGSDTGLRDVRHGVQDC